MNFDGSTERLLQKLAEARTWPERYHRDLDRGADVSGQIQESNRRIEALERQAKEAIKALGCVSPETRAVYHAMADMLISWKMFKDTLGSRG